VQPCRGTTVLADRKRSQWGDSGRHQHQKASLSFQGMAEGLRRRELSFSCVAGPCLGIQS
jgi:hypothetical protein